MIDGKGFNISDLNINRPNNWENGLFQYLYSSSVKNITAKDFQINGRGNVGFFAGYIDNMTFDNVHVISGNVDAIDYYAGLFAGGGYNIIITNSSAQGKLSGNSYMGGFLGDLYYGKIENSYASVEISGLQRLGGLVGNFESDTSNPTIINSFATGSISGSSYLGGLIGQTNRGAFSNAYSQVDVTATGDYVGGLVGSGDFVGFSNVYGAGEVVGVGQNVGVIIGIASSPVLSEVYWDKEATGWEESPLGGTGKTTAEMKTISTFADSTWNFSNVWRIKEAAVDAGHISYPYLRTIQYDSIGRNPSVNPIPGLELPILPQTITFGEIAEKTYGDSTFILGNAVTDRGLIVTYIAADTSVVRITGNQADILKVGTTTITATQPGNDSYSAANPVERILTVVPETITGITFESDTLVYDGWAKSMVITGTLPEGTTVEYSNNSRTEVGTQTVTATITGDNYTTLELTAELIVTPATITGIDFVDGSFGYDGTAYSLAISGTLPEGTSVSYADNSRTEVGTQTVTATVTGDNYTTLELTAELTVTPASITGIDFVDGSFVYDGIVHSLTISGTPPEGTTVAYSNNGRTEVGSQTVTAIITGDNYSTRVLTAELTVTPASITGIDFVDGSFGYDGIAHSLVISGTLPEGTAISYTNNSRTNVGTQTVTATITGSNYQELILTATLTITPADVEGISLANGSFIYDGTAHSLSIGGTLPNGTSVAYANNSRTEVGTQTVTATITGSNYEDLILTASLTITPATINSIEFGDGSFVYDGTAHWLAIAGTLPVGTSVAYTNNSRTDVGSQTVTATITGSNYEDLILTASLTITPATVTGITFDNENFVYDGTTKSLAIAGTIPDGTSVAYSNNSRTDVGTQTVTATITGSNYEDLILTATLVITPATVTGITFDDDSFVYDGTTHSLAITGTLPAGTSVAYTNNSRADVGSQTVTATITGSNYEDLILTAELTISPATVTGITFDDDSFVYDGTAHSLAIEGTLPEGTAVSYTNNGRTDVGSQTVTATITGSNYEDLILTASLTITPATVTGITFNDENFVYDGTTKSLAIAGTLPDGTSVAYTDNARTDVGLQIVTATITGSNYEDLILTASLTITPATVTGITFDDDSFVYDGTAHSLAITGTLPAGTSVTYTNNSRTDVGSQPVTATVTGSNYEDLILTATLTVTPATVTGITFNDDSFVYDGTTKSLAIAGTIPDETSVAYGNNSRTDVGLQTVTATITGSNYEELILTATLAITPATINSIEFGDGSFVYDGSAHSLAIAGTLPAGTSATYTNNSRTDVGLQTVTATITGSNYEDLILTATLAITPAEITGIEFNDENFVYDGTTKSLAIAGTIPDGTSVAYTNNSRTDVGTQTVTATITGSNHEDLILTAELTISPATVTGITFNDENFVYDGTAHSLSITGTLPAGTSVTYTNNSRTDVGTQTVTATITGSNHEDLILPATLVITPATINSIEFGDGSFVYDGTARSLAISGTLPTGTNVSYTNNSRTDVGSQTVTATITGSNYEDLILTATLVITPATVTGITFDDENFVYDGTTKSLTIAGALPLGTSVAYGNNSRTDVGSQTVTATITGSNYEDLILTASLTITPATVTGITFDDENFVYDGTTKSLTIAGALPLGTSVAYGNNSRTDVGSQTVTATITGSNYEELILTATLAITPATINSIEFGDGSFVYDGTAHSLAISGMLPEGTAVSYANNNRTDVGSQIVTATITGSNYEDLILTATLAITPATITGVDFIDGSFVYDGTTHSLAIAGTLPVGTSVTYTNNARTDVGTQTVTATITGSNYEDLILTATLTITPAEMEGITFGNGSFVYDGTAHSLAIVGTLPAGTSVAYTNNSRTDVGTQTVTATITGSNYEDLILTASLTITPATVTGITFDDDSFVYDGTAHSLAIAGMLPVGTSVSYTNNSRTDVGLQTVTATITGSNYEDLILTATLAITPATVTGITFNDENFVYDGTAHSLAIAGTLPAGTSVAYTNNSRTDVGLQTVTATITGSNYEDLILTASLTITPATVTGITFNDENFVYDGTAHSLAITGTLPVGTSVAYSNNSRTDVGTQTVTAMITGSNYEDLILTAELTITPATINSIEFSNGSFVYDGTAHSLAITGTLPVGTSVAYTNNSRADVGSQTVTATITGSNYEDLILTASLTITPATVTGITFDDGIFVYDGTAKSLAIAGTIPDGTSVTYTNNSRTDVGTQTVTATITGSNYEELILTATLTITPANITGIEFSNGSFVYDGNAHSLAIAGTLPEGTAVSYANNSRTDVGTQTVTATITGSNYEDLILTATLVITPATINSIEFDDDSFVYDGTAHSLAIAGTLPAETSVAYINNSRTEVGTQTVTATITGSNYEDLILTATLTVTPATVTGITFDDGIFVYDGTAHSLAIAGTLPEGTAVSYANNNRTDVGSQVVTATITGSNYEDLILTATLTITPATITGVAFGDDTFVYDGSAKSLAIAGTLPQGTSVAYTNNARADVGTQTVTATITGSNYTTLELFAELTIAPAAITGITFADDTFVYDGSAKSLTISGTLPQGTSVAYSDNSRTDVGTQTVTATITGSNYTTLELFAELTITPAAITGIDFDDDAFVYDGSAKSLAIAGTLPQGTSVAYTDNSRTDVGTQTVTATITGANYTTLELFAELTITPATITGIDFEDDAFVYDGSAKSLAIAGTLPQGTSVTYKDNSRTDVGTQTVTATITGSNYTTLELFAELTITPAAVTGITFEDDTFVYDGSAKSLAITGSLPAGSSVVYTNNARTDVGTQTVTATITGDNYSTLILTADLTVTAATITGIDFEDGSFVYDGTVHSLAITGTLPLGTSVAYTNNSRTDVGTQTVTATITGDNYSTLVLTADLTVTAATITGIDFVDNSFVYDGTAHSLAITGTLPEGTDVAYMNNSRTDVGTQTVTATITGSNYEELILTATLSVTPATITGIDFEDDAFVYDGSEKSLAITGTLPQGTSVAYTDNNRTDVGIQTVTATITGSNYEELILAAELTVTPATITGITFEDETFVYDGPAKSLAIAGTLPQGTSVAYTNNSRTDVGSQTVIATITGSNYTALVLTAELTVSAATITGIDFEDGSFVYDGTAHSLAVTGTLPTGTSVVYTNNSRTDVGTQTVTATVTGSNHTTMELFAELTITPAAITGIDFEDASFVYDGSAKSLAISGQLPIGTNVSYTNNSRTEVGTQTVTATITGDNFSTLVLSGNLTVTAAAITGIDFEDDTFVYDGLAKSLAIAGTLPQVTSVAYTNNARTDVGMQTVTATITGANYSTLELFAELTITPAAITGITFADDTFVYDGSAKSLAITGTLPQGTSVAYSNTSRTDVGTQTVTATITGSNYSTLELFAELTITPATITGLDFAGESFVYDGTAKSLSISGTLPDGTSVSYANNSKTDVGTQTVTATITGSNYIALQLDAELEITKASVTITATDKLKIYGEVNPELTFIYSGLVGGDTKTAAEPSIATTATASSDAGSYLITLSGGEDPNYAITLVNGSLTIAKTILKIQPNPHTKIFGASDPELTFTATGFKGSDNLNELTGELARESGETVGTYAIGLGTLRSGTNYQVEFSSAQFEIIPAELLVVSTPDAISTPWSILPTLPAKVDAVTSDGQVVQLSVTWDVSTLDLFKRGSYVLNGMLSLPTGVFSPDDWKATLEVNVLAKAAPQDVILSNNEFDPDPKILFQVIGNLTVIDPADTEHTITLVNGAGDNQYFEVKEGILFWSSAEEVSGKTQFSVLIQVEDRDGNVIQRDFMIHRGRTDLSELEIFNTFTPNGDGVNDTWGVPDLRYYQGVRVQVFDRSGERIFYTEDADTRWDGTYQGKEVPVGTYYWIVEVRETGKVRRGILTLLKN
jgi:gliding motility-associated-like protein